MSFKMGIWVIVLVCLLSVGCGVISPPRFSETEYRALAQLSATVDQGHCDLATTQQLMSSVVFLDHYTKYLPNNGETHNSIVTIRKQIEGLKLKVTQGDTITETYCQTKLAIIGDTIDALAQASGGKLR